MPPTCRNSLLSNSKLLVFSTNSKSLQIEWRSSLCRYCPKINHSGQTTSKTTGQKTVTMINTNCQSSNIIYLITCSSCGIQYVGQTKNRLLTRFQGHHYDIKNHNDTTVSRHFNKCPSSLPAGFDGIRISILSFIKSPSNSKAGQLERDREEKRWIHRLATVVPKGLNLMDLNLNTTGFENIRSKLFRKVCCFRFSR